MNPPNWTTEEMILACDLADDIEWGPVNSTRPEIVELSKFLRMSGIHPVNTDDTSFRSANSVALKINNLRASHPSHTGKGLRTSKKEKSVVDDFVNYRDVMKEAARQIRLLYSASTPVDTPARGAEIPNEDTIYAAVEGGAREILSIRRERDPRLRREKIASHMRDNRPLECEICSFNYHKLYGPRGSGYIEVHHRVPLHASGYTTTTMSDLILICANCHRMLHRGPWISPEELIDQIELHK